MYKIIGKLLAIKLSTVISSLVLKFQFGGLPGCNLHEGVLIANELIDSYLKDKKLWLISKVDFQKVFDTVSWSFLDSLLQKFGFGVRWCHWVKKALCTKNFLS